MNGDPAADGAGQDSGPRPGPSRWLGKFLLERELGRGGMGIVYLAHDSSLNRRMAVKVLPQSVASETRVVQRFEREAQAAARLRHKNIIPIYAAGELEGTYYYSMEYVPGVTLAQIIRGLRDLRLSQKAALAVVRVTADGHPTLVLRAEGPASAVLSGRGGGSERLLLLPQKNYVHEALRLFVDVADALDYAHKSGVVHRDIKPSNLLLAPDGRLMISDFGLAKIGDARSITRTGDLLGSPSYMSPEQTMTRRAAVDHRTDIWSLGVTLYELLTLHHPFEAKSLEVSLRNILSAEPPPPRRFNPRLPKDVETILLKALEKSPDRRYATAAALGEDLQSVLHYESIQARSVGPITRSIRFVRRHSTRLGALSLVLLLLTVAGLAFKLHFDREMQDLDLSFAYFRGVMESDAGEMFDRDTVKEIEDSLRLLRAESPSLEAAIDMLAFRELRSAEAALPGPDRPGDLEQAIRSLKKVRLVHLHNPNEMQRQRKEKVDRATADTRIRLVWAILDAILQPRPDAAAEAQPAAATLLGWLTHFTGLEERIVGLARERNVLVRRNAVEALRRLAAAGDRAPELLPLLARVAVESSAEPEVQGDALRALAAISAASHDLRVREAVAGIILKDDYFSLPVQARYGAARLLAAAPPDARGTGGTGSTGGTGAEALRRLLTDPAAAVREAAEAGLRGAEQG